MTSSQEAAQAWLDLDKDPETRAEVSNLLESDNGSALDLCFTGRLAFGTAGLRGPMRAGPNGMNSLVVIQTSQGLASYVTNNIENAQKRGIVIGRDARHRSEQFARLAAAAFVEKGFRVIWLHDAAPTPLVPFAIGKYGAAAGIMITASHNPKDDNGYKVYWENGCQIIPPHDSGIASAIEQNLKPVSWDETAVDRIASAYILEPYCEKILSLGFDLFHAPSFVYTPLHGVGLTTLRKLLRIADADHLLTVVPTQAHPDPSFPTVKFPNPEELGALDDAIATADHHGIHLILANDPDADRLAVAERLPSGTWHQFTGNQLGILLAAYILDAHNGPIRNVAMLSSTVSSSMLAALARVHGFHHAETLTGFKWLGNIGRQLQTESYDVTFAFEEALGYMNPAVCWDKDGISAALLVLRALSAWQCSLYEKLQILYKEVGFFADANTYLISPAPEVTSAAFEAIRASAHPDPYPAMLGQHKITYWRDLTMGYDSSTPDNKPVLPVDAGSQMITVELDNGVRFTARGSGTEPKIKLYVEARGTEEEEAKEKAMQARELLIEEWFPVKLTLRRPS